MIKSLLTLAVCGVLTAGCATAPVAVTAEEAEQARTQAPGVRSVDGEDIRRWGNSHQLQRTLSNFVPALRCGSF